jgi:FAD:protein FMN transferase
MKHASSLFTALAFSLSVFLVFSGCLEARGNSAEESKLLMGTTINIKVPLVPGLDEDRAKGAIDKAFGEIERVESVFSVYRNRSEASRINSLKAGQKLAVSAEMFHLIQACVRYSEITEGAFDITVKPLMDLWNNCKREGRLPSRTELNSALEKVGWRQIVLDKNKKTVSFRREGMALDFGGVAKGYASDRAARVLKMSGIRSAVIDCGGDVFCLGRSSKWHPWTVGIRHPREKGKLISEIPVENEAVDTSGDYENYFILEGKRYSHIIDPRSGYPVGDTTASATVIAKDATSADALATGLCVLGKSGMKIIDSDPDLGAIIIEKTGVGGLSVNLSNSLKEKVHVEKIQ